VKTGTAQDVEALDTENRARARRHVATSIDVLQANPRWPRKQSCRPPAEKNSARAELRSCDAVMATHLSRPEIARETVRLAEHRQTRTCAKHRTARLQVRRPASAVPAGQGTAATLALAGQNLDQRSPFRPDPGQPART